MSGSSVRRVVAAVAASTTMLTAACGTNVSHDRVVLANGGLAPSNVTAAGGTVAPAGDGTVAPGDAGGGAGTGGTDPGTATVGPGTGTDPGATGGQNGGTAGGSGNGSGNGTTTGTGTTGGSNGGSKTGGTGTTRGGTTGTTAAGSGGIGGDIITAKCSGTGTGTIKLGNIAPYSGTGQGATVTPGKQILNVWASYVNAHGGICGRQIQLFVKDDAGNASQSAAAYRDLIENQKVVAFVMGTTTTTLPAFQGYVEGKQVPIIGGDMVTGVWNRSSDFFPSGASITEQDLAFYRSVQKLPNGTKIAALYCSEVAACSDSYKFQAQNKLPEKVGSRFVYSKQVSLTQISFAAECQAAKKAGAGVILGQGDNSFVGRIASSCGQQGINLAYLVAGLTASDDMTANKYLEGHTYAVTAGQPWLATNTPGSKLYSSLTGQYNAQRNGFSVMAFTSAMITQQVLTQLGATTPTSANILRTLRSLKGFTAGGLSGPLTYHNGAQAQGQCTGTSLISGGRWVPLNGGNLVCRSGAPGPVAP